MFKRILDVVVKTNQLLNSLAFKCQKGAFGLDFTEAPNQKIHFLLSFFFKWREGTRMLMVEKPRLTFVTLPVANLSKLEASFFPL